MVQLGAAQRALAAETEAADQHIDLAQQMAREALAEARRSVWNLRAPALGRGDLSDAARPGQPPDPARDHHQLRAARRALAAATNNEVGAAASLPGGAGQRRQARWGNPCDDRALEYTPEEVRLSVSDDGAGFDDLALPQGVARRGRGAALGCWACASAWRRWAARAELSNNGGAMSSRSSRDSERVNR